ncbi:sugar-transfer associated ATP-grasp domain-containing protein [Sporosarcina aquimarina]|uniref:Sugar-transfer associated ATP-grasp domain-containing protein n=1 Tax=Sporosarcina aquimarina TaxID=114975 RepID=A0ABU4G4W8_9BACL|nr:sugar-transfer associated ATP-grasp domain-containing protein [Sporosarcina aquimarina]MDW0110677.1 sugar-transfer associated ATP-grasp domain-containing protein [Sporosarcina aquimarina]
MTIKSGIKEVMNRGMGQMNQYRLVSGNRKKIVRLFKLNPELDKPLSDEYKIKIDSYWEGKFNRKIKKDWHQAYTSVTGIEDERFIPEDLFYSFIEPRLNYTHFQKMYADKNFYTKFFQNVEEPNIILRNIHGIYYGKNYEKLTPEDAEALLADFSEKVIVKPSIDTGDGKDIEILEVQNDSYVLHGTPVTLRDIEKRYGGSDFVLQGWLEQHKSLGEVYPRSLNTLRILTLRLNHDIHVLSSVVRFGNNGESIDNQMVGGLSCGLDEDGNFNEYAIDKFGNKYTHHPYTGYEFVKGRVHHVELIKEKAAELHNQVKYFSLVSWDMALNDKGEPILIEINLAYQDINFHQFNTGTLFGEHTDAVLHHVLKKPSKDTIDYFEIY